MSVIGVSVGDFALVAKIINDIYSAYKSGPQKLTDMLDTLKDLESHADNLQSILENANVQNCPKYSGFDKLKKDLLDAQLFLAKFRTLSEPSSRVRRFVGATNLTIRGDQELMDWRDKFSGHRDRLESYKTLLILSALSNNHRAGGLDTSGNPDQDDIVLQRAIAILQQRKQSLTTQSPVITPLSPQSMLSTAPTLVDRSYGTAKRYEDIISYIEASKLHYRDNFPQNNPRAWAEVIEKLETLLPNNGLSPASTGFLRGPITASPETMKKSREDAKPIGRVDTLLTLPSLSPSPFIVELEGSLPSSTQMEHVPMLNPPMIWDQLPQAPLIVDDSRSELLSRQRIQFSGRVQVSCELMTNLLGKQWIDVALEISQVGPFLCMWAISQDVSLRVSANSSNPRPLRPQDLLGNQIPSANNLHAGTTVTLKHVLCNPMDSYPVIHHPSVEKGALHIEFSSPQHIEIDGAHAGTKRTSRLVYRFDNKEDRDELRSLIFSKKLLASAGYQNVKPAGVCDLQAVSLWIDTRTGPAERTTSYITLPCNGKGSQSGPDRVLLFRVTGCPKLAQAKKKNERLVLEIEPVPTSLPDFNGMSPRSSVVSGGTDSSRRSNQRGYSRSNSFKIEKSNTCEILLSEHDDERSRDKKKFLRLLKAQFEPG